MNKIKVGDTVLVTTNDWFYAPDGKKYKAVFGDLIAIENSENTLGVKTNAKSTNWYMQIGNMIVAGCQIHYCIKTQTVCDESITETHYNDQKATQVTRDPEIYLANA